MDDHMGPTAIVVHHGLQCGHSQSSQSYCNCMN